MDPLYYREREQAELRMAEHAATDKARAIHLDLAGRYSRLAETYAQAALPEQRAA